jgi:uncharacterized protein YndB with AHSA1/START domain
MANNSVTLHRVFKASPEKVYRAFTERSAFAAWLPPYGYVAEVQQMDVTAGGNYKMSFTNFTTGNIQSFGGRYLEIEANKLLKYSDAFDDPNLPGEMTTTVRFEQVSVGTELSITQEGIPAAIPPEACYLGWEESLEKLKRLVEAEVLD